MVHMQRKPKAAADSAPTTTDLERRPLMNARVQGVGGCAASGAPPWHVPWHHSSHTGNTIYFRHNSHTSGDAVGLSHPHLPPSHNSHVASCLYVWWQTQQRLPAHSQITLEQYVTDTPIHHKHKYSLVETPPTHEPSAPQTAAPAFQQTFHQPSQQTVPSTNARIGSQR